MLKDVWCHKGIKWQKKKAVFVSAAIQKQMSGQREIYNISL